MSVKVWLDDMDEISGFGGEYEAACRRMLLAGAEWITAHPQATLSARELSGVYGIVFPNTDETKELMACIADACGTGPSGPSGAMMHCVTQHLLFIKKHGWDAYCARMRERRHEA